MTPPPRILLIEDDMEQATLFAQVLRLANYELVAVPNAKTALALLNERTIDLILVDWKLPDMSGDTLIANVKATRPQLPIILYSNHVNVDEIATACGADAWYRKCDDIFGLRHVVAKLLHAR